MMPVMLSQGSMPERGAMTKLIQLCLTILFAGTLIEPSPVWAASTKTEEKPATATSPKKTPEKRRIHRHKHRLLKALGKAARKG